MRGRNPELDVCGCCGQKGCKCGDPSPLNPPGQDALRFRLGTHLSFLREMIASLAITEVPDANDESGPPLRPLAALTTREPSDPSIAMLDAFAVVGDVLTFYQERIVNEGYLRTATERRSVLELAREIGYELSPGVAASTWLAFTVEEAKTAPLFALVVQGTKVQSVPGPGELPQTFETGGDLTARVEWNALKPVSTQPQELSIAGGKLLLAGATEAKQIFFAGTTTRIKAGDVLLVEAAGKVLPLVARRVVADEANQRTRVDLAEQPSVPVLQAPALPVATPGKDPIEQTLDSVRDLILGKTWEEQDLMGFLEAKRWSRTTLLTQVQALLQAQTSAVRVNVFRQHLGFFGNNAPAWSTLPRARSGQTLPPNWDGRKPNSIWQASDKKTYAEETGTDTFLERDVPEAVLNAWTVFRVPPETGQTAIYLVAYVYQGTGAASKAAQKMAAPMDAATGAVWKQKANEEISIRDQSRAQPDPSEFTPYWIRTVGRVSRADYALSSKSTGLVLAQPGSDDSAGLGAIDVGGTSVPLRSPDTPDWMTLRKTVAYLQPEVVPLSKLPLETPIEGDGGGASGVTLDRMVLGFSLGRPVLITGIEAGGAGVSSTGVPRSEIALLLRVSHAGGRTSLAFKKPLKYRYVRSTFAINANVIGATNGETVAREVLGSGDGATANQVFALKKQPLTFITASTPSGAQSTLTVRADGVKWSEVPSLYGKAQRDRVYAVRLADDGTTSVIFGDGVQGARLPTGRENVVANYRVGIGPAGEVGAGKLTLLANRPLGIKSVVNPLAAGGSAPPEKLADARANAPRTVLTLGRVVSLDDYQDFARSFAGIGKAQAVALWSGRARIVHLTVAGASGDAVDSNSPLYQSLSQAIATSSDGSHLPQIDSFQKRTFKLSATLAVQPEYQLPAVHAAAFAALQDAFSFDSRGLGQSVTEVEVVSLLQSVAGVAFVKVEKLHFAGEAEEARAVLPAQVAHWDGSAIVPAELLLPAADGFTLVEARP